MDEGKPHTYVPLYARGWFSLGFLVEALNCQPGLSVRKPDQLLVPVEAF
jgi:hypothetical protein